MSLEDVKRNGTEIVNKCGVRDSEGNIIVPIEYDFVEQVNDNLFVATKGDINGLRYEHKRRCTVEKGGTYGVVFERMVKSKTLETEVDFYTQEGKIDVGDKKILAAIVCKNQDMLLVLDSHYRWSMVLLDYENNIMCNGAYTSVNSIKMDYKNNRFIIGIGKQYVILSIDESNKIIQSSPMLDCKPVELYDKGALAKKREKYGFINFSGEVILDFIYSNITPKTAFIVAEKDRESLYNYSGQLIVGEGKFKRLEEELFCDGNEALILIKKDSGYGLYSTNKGLLPCEYTSISLCGEYVIANKKGKCGLLKYNAKTDELKPYYPFNYPEKSYKNMRFICRKDATYVETKNCSIQLF